MFLDLLLGLFDVYHLLKGVSVFLSLAISPKIAYFTYLFDGYFQKNTLGFLLLLLLLLLFNYFFFFETGFLCIVVAVLKLIL